MDSHVRKTHQEGKPVNDQQQAELPQMKGFKRNRKWRVVLSGITFMFKWDVKIGKLFVWQKGSRSKKELTASQLADAAIGQFQLPFQPTRLPDKPSSSAQQLPPNLASVGA